jgi:hypothetical protein
MVQRMSENEERAGLFEREIEALREEEDVTRWIEAGAPSPLDVWRQLDGVPHADTIPLTVAQAADRMNMSEKWVRSRLRRLETMEPRGAYRTSSGSRAPWRIIPAALDRLHEQSVEPKPAAPSRARAETPKGKKRSPTRWEV